MDRLNISELRREYSKQELNESHVIQEPSKQFAKWFSEALNSEVPEPNAFTLSTVNNYGRPSSRVVLLKELKDGNLVFYTNYKSKKGKEMAGQPWVAVNFLWLELERQVRVEGMVEKVPALWSDEYFNSRPYDSRIGALVSSQSEKVVSREVLEERWKELNAFYKDKTIERPAHWGGYLIKPTYWEFWQGRPSRLHDRISFSLTEEGAWEIERLQP